MKRLLVILLLISGTVSCKKGDITTPVEQNPMKGKLKSMKVQDYIIQNDSSFSIYNFEYDGNGNLLKMHINDRVYFELITNISDNPVIKFYRTDNIVVDYEVSDNNNIIHSIFNKTFSKLVYSTVFNGDELVESTTSLDLFNGLYPIMNTTDKVVSNLLKTDNKYSFDLDFTHLASPPFSYVDVAVHYDCSIKKLNLISEIPLPLQSLGQFDKWSEIENNSDIKLLFFLSLVGLHIGEYDNKLTDKWLLDDEDSYYKFQYKTNDLGQIIEMKYGPSNMDFGKFEFDYY